MALAEMKMLAMANWVNSNAASSHKKYHRYDQMNDSYSTGGTPNVRSIYAYIGTYLYGDAIREDYYSQIIDAVHPTASHLPIQYIHLVAWWYGGLCVY